MPSSDAPSPETFEADARDLLESIERARDRVEGIAGLVDGTLDRFRERIDRLIRESEVDNWRQVRIFTRDVDTIAADLGKASKEKRLSPRLVAALDVSLRKARKRDFCGARKAWRKLDKLAQQGAEVRQLQGTYRESYKGVEARIRQLRTQVERLEKIPKPPMSPEDARTFNEDVDAFNEAATAAYLDFLARSRADVAIPLLLDAAQGRGIGVPAGGGVPQPLVLRPPRATRVLRREAHPRLRRLPSDPERAGGRVVVAQGGPRGRAPNPPNPVERRRDGAPPQDARDRRIRRADLERERRGREGTPLD